eukprot:3530690-Prymnesium_polylepis.1
MPSRLGAGTNSSCTLHDLSKAAANAASHPESCTMIEVHVEAITTAVVRGGDIQTLGMRISHKDKACVLLRYRARPEH